MEDFYAQPVLHRTKGDFFQQRIWLFPLHLFLRLPYQFPADKIRLTDHQGVFQLVFFQIIPTDLCPDALQRADGEVVDFLLQRRRFVGRFDRIRQSVQRTHAVGKIGPVRVSPAVYLDVVLRGDSYQGRGRPGPVKSLALFSPLIFHEVHHPFADSIPLYT